jgi:hypothetical protein
MYLAQRLAKQGVGCRGICHQPRHEGARILRRIFHHRPGEQRMIERRICLEGAGHCYVDDLVRHVRIRFGGRGGNGFQLAIVRTQSRALSLSAIPGKCRRSSTTADSSPLSSNT